MNGQLTDVVCIHQSYVVGYRPNPSVCSPAFMNSVPTPHHISPIPRLHKQAAIYVSIHSFSLLTLMIQHCAINLFQMTSSAEGERTSQLWWILYYNISQYNVELLYIMWPVHERMDIEDHRKDICIHSYLTILHYEGNLTLVKLISELDMGEIRG